MDQSRMGKDWLEVCGELGCRTGLQARLIERWLKNRWETGGRRLDGT